MSGTVYAVFREGVYRHECGGIFMTLDKATACADLLAESDVDDHHEYRVVPFMLDQAGELADGWAGNYSGAISEADPIYTAKGKPKRGRVSG